MIVKNSIGKITFMFGLIFINLQIINAQILDVQPRLVREIRLPNNYADGGFIYVPIPDGPRAPEDFGIFPSWFFDGSHHYITDMHTGQTNVFDLQFKLVEHLTPVKPFSVFELYDPEIIQTNPKPDIRRFSNGDYLTIMKLPNTYARYSMMGKLIATYSIDEKKKTLFQSMGEDFSNRSKISVGVWLRINDNDLIFANYDHRNWDADFIKDYVSSVVLSTGKTIGVPIEIQQYVESTFLRYSWTKVNKYFAEKVIDKLKDRQGYIHNEGVSDALVVPLTELLVQYFAKYQVDLSKPRLFIGINITETGFRVRLLKPENYQVVVLYFNLITNKVYKVTGLTPYSRNTKWDDAGKRAWVYDRPEGSKEVIVKEYALDFLN